MELSLIYSIPLWVLTLFLVGILLAALELGLRLGLQQQGAMESANEGGGEIVMTSLFAMLGLILAFTYGGSVERYEARRQAIVHEANVLGTAFVTARLVAEPERTELREALRDYARTRQTKTHGGHLDSQERRKLLKLSLDKQAHLWPVTERIVLNSRAGVVEKSLIDAINNVLSAHTFRLDAINNKLPDTVLWMLTLLSMSSLIIAGFHTGISGRVSRCRLTFFALVLTGMIGLITDFDRPGEGLIRVPHDIILMTIADMEAELGQSKPPHPNNSK